MIVWWVPPPVATSRSASTQEHAEALGGLELPSETVAHPGLVFAASGQV